MEMKKMETNNVEEYTNMADALFIKTADYNTVTSNFYAENQYVKNNISRVTNLTNEVFYPFHSVVKNVALYFSVLIGWVFLMQEIFNITIINNFFAFLCIISGAMFYFMGKLIEGRKSKVKIFENQQFSAIIIECENDADEKFTQISNDKECRL
jgi:hypothetical protein